MVSAPSIAELVTLDLLDALDTIDGPPDNAEDLHVYRMGGNIMDVPLWPCAILIDRGTEETDGAANGTIQVIHHFDVVFATTAVGSSWAEDVRAIAADVSNKLREDWTRGGYARTTHVESGEVWDSEADGGQLLGAGQVSLSVLYRHLYADPTAAF